MSCAVPGMLRPGLYRLFRAPRLWNAKRPGVHGAGRGVGKFLADSALRGKSVLSARASRPDGLVGHLGWCGRLGLGAKSWLRL
ncbi:protein of unknown function [Cupriavidus taiwanensis]|uniref:Uncharacterized protein n=2 Tax=Cupriavidus TaxID=106589 RepID=A0A375IIC6_9BURK|nr:hypothetical protein CBM2588_A60253 [Cupriavidus taiwanensis]SOY57059.1 hypothetical protein CBM2592_A90345 [Cupriavidus taiwanensis]SOY79144.1 hypothetical protein CBM2591_A100036 [Cupriavidus taiwanensis]SOZ25913.1 hypothetical protein CBM2608_A60077 [Cupriavidus taiwanensis]SOZ64548.1 hypothetical protein CBM2617_A80036 [Cupriavidus taiwanensis]